MTELVLVRPGRSSRAELHWSKALPLGIGYLAGSARAAGLDVAIVDAKIMDHDSPEETVAAIRELNRTVVGLSALTVELASARAIARALKNFDSKVITILGGAHANALPGETLAHSPEFDYLMTGESETSLVAFVNAIKAGVMPVNIPGLWQRNADGACACQSPARYDHDIAALPYPAWDLFPRQDTYPIIAERGCPYRCVFCSNNMAHNIRSRPIEHIVAELEWLHKKFAPSWIYFEDETFGLRKEATAELLARIVEFNRGVGIRFKAQTRIDTITPELANLMKQAGFEYLEIGVESGDQEVLKLSKKGIRADTIAEAVATVKHAGIKPWVNFIIGLPGETAQTVRSSINLAVRLNPERLSVAIIVAYPGTEIYSWALANKNGYRLLSQDWSRFDKYLSASVELENLPYSTMRRLQLQMYGETYLRNLRFGDFLNLIWTSRSFAMPILKSLLNYSDKLHHQN